MNMHLIELSLEIALKAYSSQTDKAGKPYILHPLRLMAKMDTDEERSVALLHDVIEDSDLTEQDLLSYGIPPNIIDAVKLLSKKEGESYEDFINRISFNELASKVKMADIEDNMNLLRLDVISSKDLARVAKYHNAWKQLNNQRQL